MARSIMGAWCDAATSWLAAAAGDDDYRPALLAVAPWPGALRGAGGKPRSGAAAIAATSNGGRPASAIVTARFEAARDDTRTVATS